MLRYNLSHPSWWLCNCWDTFLWWCVCSNLRDCLALCLFHPLRWFGFRSSEGQELLVLKASPPLPSSCFSEGCSFEGSLQLFSWATPHFPCKLNPKSWFSSLCEAWSLEEGCSVFAASPPPLQSCSKDFCSKYFLVCDIHFWLSQRFHGCGSSRVVSPLAF